MIGFSEYLCAMFKRYEIWYQGLTPLQQFLAFGKNWIYCFIAWLIGEKYYLDEQRSWGSYSTCDLDVILHDSSMGLEKNKIILQQQCPAGRDW